MNLGRVKLVVTGWGIAEIDLGQGWMGKGIRIQRIIWLFLEECLKTTSMFHHWLNLFFLQSEKINKNSEKLLKCRLEL